MKAAFKISLYFILSLAVVGYALFCNAVTLGLYRTMGADGFYPILFFVIAAAVFLGVIGDRLVTFIDLI